MTGGGAASQVANEASTPLAMKRYSASMLK
jgi:hypothetical protein